MKATTSRRLAAITMLLAAPLLGSCGVNFGAQTDQVYQPAEGTNVRDGEVDVLNAMVVADEEGNGRFIAGLANNSDRPQTLTGVSGVGTAQSLDITLDSGADFTVPPLGFVQLADPEAGMVAVSGEALDLGYFLDVRLTFSDAQAVEMSVPVVPNTQDYAGVELPSADNEEPSSPDNEGG